MAQQAARSARGGGDQARPGAYELLKRAVLQGEFKPGEPLREVHLAQWCGVSRTPVREALRRLEQDGLIHWEGPSLTVRRRSPEEILDIYTTRIVLESTVASVAAERRTDHDLRQLDWALDRAASVTAGDAAALVEVNAAFNRRVWQASHNESLIDLLERLNLHLGRYPETTLVAPGRWERSKQAHEELVAAIRERDADGAAEIATRHFTQAREIRLALFAAEDAGGGRPERSLRGARS